MGWRPVTTPCYAASVSRRMVQELTTPLLIVWKRFVDAFQRARGFLRCEQPLSLPGSATSLSLLWTLTFHLFGHAGRRAGSLGGSAVKNPPAMQQMSSTPGSGRSPGGGTATHCSALAWRTPWTEGPGGLQTTRGGLPKCQTRPRRLSAHAREPALEVIECFWRIEPPRPQAWSAPGTQGGQRAGAWPGGGVQTSRRRASPAGRAQESEQCPKWEEAAPAAWGWARTCSGFGFAFARRWRRAEGPWGPKQGAFGSSAAAEVRRLRVAVCKR